MRVTNLRGGKYFCWDAADFTCVSGDGEIATSILEPLLMFNRVPILITEFREKGGGIKGFMLFL